jgi:hypothetical protein
LANENKEKRKRHKEEAKKEKAQLKEEKKAAAEERKKERQAEKEKQKGARGNERCFDVATALGAASHSPDPRFSNRCTLLRDQEEDAGSEGKQ